MEQEPGPVDKTDKASKDWRATVKKIVQSIVEPDDLNWMDDDESLTDAQYIHRALQDIESRFEQRPLYNSTESGRIALATALARLPCAIAGEEATPCFAAPRKPGMATISLCMRLSFLLLDGPRKEVTPAVRKTVYEALARNTVHNTTGFGGNRLDVPRDFIIRGMKDADRSVRLSAGRALIELVRLHQMIGGEASARLEPVFDGVLSNCESAEIPVVETALVTVCSIGNVLFQPLSFLISFLGHANSVIRGIAFMQITLLAKQHKKTVYALMSPYLTRIIPRLFSHLSKEPAILSEACRLLGTAPRDFILGTRYLSLPHICASSDLRALELMATETSESVAVLLTRAAGPILAHAFLLPPGQTGKAIGFVTSIMRSNNEQIETKHIVASFRTEILAEILVAMGEDDERATDRGMEALIRVERSLGNEGGDVLDIISKRFKSGMYPILNELQKLLGLKRPEEKKQVIRGLAPFVRQVGPPICDLGHQLMAMLQTAILKEGMAEASLQSWYALLTTLNVRDVGPHVCATTATFVSLWSKFSPEARKVAKECLHYIVIKIGRDLGMYMNDIAGMQGIPELADIQNHLLGLRRSWTSKQMLVVLLDRATSQSVTVATCALAELKSFILQHEKFIHSLSSGDAFDKVAGRLVSTLFAAAGRVGEGSEELSNLAFECIGILGAIDPDRLEMATNDSRMVVMSNFTEEEESMNFALHLLQDILYDTYRTTNDMEYHTHISFVIQTVLQFCGFTPAILPGSGGSVPLKVRKRWERLRQDVTDTLAPLVKTHYKMRDEDPKCVQHPLYPAADTFVEWIQSWAGCLITNTSGERARLLFRAFLPILHNPDVGIISCLLPHLVLNVLRSGKDVAVQNIRAEILSVLEDQVNPDSVTSTSKKELCAQTVFTIMDHLNYWLRLKRKEINAPKDGKKHGNDPMDENDLLRVDSILTSIDRNLMARAAFRCKAYARALMSFEQLVLDLQPSGNSPELLNYYERLHEIYANIDEPDGMQGVSTFIFQPSLEHRIREHEVTGRWTSAQSCWEVGLQQSPDDLTSHLGLLRCLKNLGHYDTMRTHLQGVLSRHPQWHSALIEYQVESQWMSQDWNELRSLVQRSEMNATPIILTKVFLAMQDGDPVAVSNALTEARRAIGSPIVDAVAQGYRRSYEAVLGLHLVHELEMIHQLTYTPGADKHNAQNLLLEKLSSRLDSTLPVYRIRETILGTRRAAFGLHVPKAPFLRDMISQSWLLSAKLARKNGYWQTAYSATLQAQNSEQPFAFMESVKLLKAEGKSVRALQELDSSVKAYENTQNKNKNYMKGIIDLTIPDDAASDAKVQKLKAKAYTLRARWMHEADGYDHSYILMQFQESAEMCTEWESGWFHYGNYQDLCYRELRKQDQVYRGQRMNFQTVRCFVKAMKLGSKYIYQAIPRLLTLWLDMAEASMNTKIDWFPKLQTEVTKGVHHIPAWKWYTAFPQIVSRIGLKNKDSYNLLAKLIRQVMREYPEQTLWLFASVVQSNNQDRKARGAEILNQLRTQVTNDVASQLYTMLVVIKELLALCQIEVAENLPKFSLARKCRSLTRVVPSPLIVPLQEYLNASVPPASSSDADHQPFPVDIPTFASISDDVVVMRSLARPKKLTVQGSDGQIHHFLCKPKDDLRKDARLMDCNSIINRLLKSNSESRRRQLHIRTYGVVTLNEECGLIQWVPNTMPLRSILFKLYENRGQILYPEGVESMLAEVRRMTDKEGVKLYKEKILCRFTPPMMHEWFLETFPEPSAWFASRSAFARTSAVWSMVGFIVGLGDRHAENILMDQVSGDVVHVDFNMLFEKGKILDVPERVPFRLTPNMVDGFGVTGVEGVFRVSCEITMELLRKNKDVLMTILDAFVHDPLCEWVTDKAKHVRWLFTSPSHQIDLHADMDYEQDQRSSRNPIAGPPLDMKNFGKMLLQPIEKKFRGIYAASKAGEKEKYEKPYPTSALVQVLIKEAMELQNLSKMYHGWAPWL
ncbi:hypothetical protein K474DRAFT_1682349 [Panus rudis PR-1116 ss-1]|nr:hypothetical protein K474DRAFT_1682349 [Panus rudis PR-1116 ss-1]